MEDDALDFKRRIEIYNFILKYPGLHLSELSRKLNIPKSTMFYHLNMLKKHSFIVSKSNNRYTRYYAANNLSEIEKKFLNFLGRTHAIFMTGVYSGERHF